MKKKYKEWVNHETYLEKHFEFLNFREAMANMMQIAFIAEELNHHPEWFNVYNKLEIKLTTHDAGGITVKDWELARRIDELIDDKAK